MHSQFHSSLHVVLVNNCRNFDDFQIPKEELEKEKLRWQQKHLEVEEQLRKAEESNADYLQIKAELV